MKDMTYEKAMERLEEIVKELENGALSLDKSLKIFEEGTRLSKYCNDCLNAAELKITQFIGQDDEGEN
ncbi:MAG: exodeoxyribonuclease VII small subunit [Clostridia bacterium]|nr:exodeoxyribonuclease VII small subunit [Clostridia bacterium]